MNGKLGAIYIGKKQVGGFIDWKVNLNLTNGIDGENTTHHLQSWKVSAWAHWLTRRVDVGTKVRIRLCSDVGRAYWEGSGRIASRLTDTLYTLIHVQVEILGSGELEAGAVPSER